MAKSLVIVESPAKIKTLKKFLGPNYFFESSVGHIRDLPEKEFGIDIEHDFEPKYVVLSQKKEVVKKLIAAAKKADVVYLSPDPDREGEAIAWHIAAILPKNIKVMRTSFQSITKNAVQEALAHPRDIDIDLVNAQQARRLLDRIVGYKISPILTRKVKRGRNGSSAGRVQSVALKLVVDREKEIEAFVPVEYWNLGALLLPKSGSSFLANLYSVDGLKVEKEALPGKECTLIGNEKKADEIVRKLKKAAYKVSSVEKKEKKRHPVPPFITSTLQQEASRHYGFSVARTMNIAQGLYEGVDMGPEGSEGLITYMRTDSVHIVPEAIAEARKYIEKKFGSEYLPAEPRHYTSRKSAQEAHEAIRPTSLARSPEKIKAYLSIEQFKIYLLIWRRFIASQMAPALYDSVSAEIATDQGLILRATGSVITFNGFLAIYEEKQDKNQDDDANKLLPPLEVGMPLKLENTLSTQSFTKPPPRFTEASLVKELEKLGIGRPSTYASIMGKIQGRDYTVKENNALKPTDLGRVIAQMLEDNFKLIMDVGFTAAMEDELEQVAEHKKEWKETIRHFWHNFMPLVEKAEKDAVVPKLLTDIDCPKCGHKLQKIWSRNKYFYGCSNYPTCEFTTPLEALTFNKEDYDPNFDWDQACPQCGAPMTLRHGRFGPFLGCSKYPDCKGIVNIIKKEEALTLPAHMPKCPAIGCSGTITPRKSRFGKRFFSCTNYPDCDVIANSLEDLPQKYKDHPKTAYVKKTGPKGNRSSLKYHLSPELAELLGDTDLTRGEVTKRIWDYIKANKLQDPNNRRRIIPDEKLAKIFGSPEPIDMFKLATVLTPHLGRG